MYNLLIKRVVGHYIAMKTHIPVERLSNPPLVLVLAVIKFAQLPAKDFEDAILQLHRVIRKEYPGIERGKDKNIQVLFNQQEDQLHQEVKQTEEPSVTFSSSDSSWLIKINTTSLAVFTRKYISFENLLDKISGIINQLEKKIGITHTSNMGLRYINRIDINTDTGFNDSITDGFLQPKIIEFEAMAGSDMVNIYQAHSGWCILRTSLKIQGHEVPNDLLPIAHKMRFALEPVNNIFASIDIDSNTMSHDYIEFNIEGIRNCFSELHSLVKIAFGSVLTDAEIQRRI